VRQRFFSPRRAYLRGQDRRRSRRRPTASSRSRRSGSCSSMFLWARRRSCRRARRSGSTRRLRRASRRVGAIEWARIRCRCRRDPSKPAQLRWEGPARVSAGKSFSVALRVSSGQQVRASPMQLSFKPELLEALGVRAGKFFGEGSFSYRINPDGSIFVGASTSGAAPGADAELLVVTFRPSSGAPRPRWSFPPSPCRARRAAPSRTTRFQLSGRPSNENPGCRRSPHGSRHAGRRGAHGVQGFDASRGARSR